MRSPAESVETGIVAGVSLYLDHAATTPLRPAARAAMLRVLDGEPGNPSGGHRNARVARRLLDDARDVLAGALGCGSGDIVFTAGGTEADNLAVLGVTGGSLGSAAAAAACSAVEHHAVLEPVLHRGGVVLPVDCTGRVDVARLADALPRNTAVVSVMAANNEVGTINPLPAVAAAVAERTDGGAVLHTDAVAAFPWLDLRELTAAAALISVSAHKFGGPQGVGALVVRPGVPLRARLLGGGQERERRSGTQNVAGIVAMAAAADRLVADRHELVSRVATLRDRFVDGVVAAVDGVRETVADRSMKVAGNAHLCVAGVLSEELLFLLDRAGLCASAASSCASGAIQLSHVLDAMGVDPAWGGGAVRFTLGWTTTQAEVDRAVEVVADAVTTLRRARPCG